MIRRTKFDHLAVESKRAAVAGKSEVLNREILASVLSILDKSGLGSNLKTKGKHQWTKIMSGITSFSFSRLKIDPNHPQSELWTGKPLPSALLISTLEVLPRNYGGNGMTYIETTNMSDFQVTKSEISIINQDLYLIFMSYIWIHLGFCMLLSSAIHQLPARQGATCRWLSFAGRCWSRTWWTPKFPVDQTVGIVDTSDVRRPPSSWSRRPLRKRPMRKERAVSKTEPRLRKILKMEIVEIWWKWTAVKRQCSEKLRENCLICLFLQFDPTLPFPLQHPVLGQ